MLDFRLTRNIDKLNSRGLSRGDSENVMFHPKAPASASGGPRGVHQALYTDDGESAITMAIANPQLDNSKMGDLH